MESLYEFQNNLLAHTPRSFKRYLYNRIDWGQRMIGIKGLRGAGKTTLMLQYVLNSQTGTKNMLYVTADHPWFYTHSLFELADYFYKYGGKTLLIDEVHKYAGWSNELKLIYDGFPDLQVIFTASSALEIYRGEADLSRRVQTWTLHGLSFREFLWLNNTYRSNAHNLKDVLHNHEEVAREITNKTKILASFKAYLKKGYLPFFIHDPQEIYLDKILRTINTTIEYDLSSTEGYSAGNIVQIKKLLGVIAESAPFTPNISALARKMQLGRDTINYYLLAMDRAGLLHLVHKAGKGVATLQKPDKIFMGNTNLSFAFKEHPDSGALRETFFYNQLAAAGHRIVLPEKGDFLVDDSFLFEIGGKNKSGQQLVDVANSFIAADEIEAGFRNKVPLWLFGFLY
ncbi:MAG: AAA family ATPase [Cyclobacteriaceae bacterium]|nr:AAA family ATPase [Cyclobacteriaceae bacterium]